MIGFDIDLWTRQLVEKVVSSFGLLMIWEEDHYNLARAVVKVRVSSLEDIPWFFVFTEGVGPDTDSWSVQTEMIQATMIGNAAQDEDFPLMMGTLIQMFFIFIDLVRLDKALLHHHQQMINLPLTWNINRLWVGEFGHSQMPMEVKLMRHQILSPSSLMEVKLRTIRSLLKRCCR